MLQYENNHDNHDEDCSWMSQHSDDTDLYLSSDEEEEEPQQQGDNKSDDDDDHDKATAQPPVPVPFSQGATTDLKSRLATLYAQTMYANAEVQQELELEYKEQQRLKKQKEEDRRQQLQKMQKSSRALYYAELLLHEEEKRKQARRRRQQSERQDKKAKKKKTKSSSSSTKKSSSSSSKKTSSLQRSKSMLNLSTGTEAAKTTSSSSKRSKLQRHSSMIDLVTSSNNKKKATTSSTDGSDSKQPPPPEEEKPKLQQRRSSMSADKKTKSTLSRSKSSPNLKAMSSSSSKKKKSSSSTTDAAESPRRTQSLSNLVRGLFPNDMLQQAAYTLPAYSVDSDDEDDSSTAEQPADEFSVRYNVDLVHAVLAMDVPHLRKLLRRKGPLLYRNVVSEQHSGEPLIHVACRQCDMDTVQFLLDEARVDINAVDGKGKTVLHHICARPVLRDELLTLVLQRVDPRLLLHEDSRGNTPFDYVRAEAWRSWKAFCHVHLLEIVLPRLHLTTTTTAAASQ